MAKQKTIQRPASKATAIPLRVWERDRFFEWLVFAFAFILFANSIPNDYNMDDELVTINHRLTSKGISAIPEIFTSPYYQDQFGYAYEYRPVVLATFAVEHEIFGDNPHISHFFNVVLYALTCLLLFLVLKRLFKSYSPLISVAITLIFIAHPAHTEVVCSIKSRDEILGLLFGLLTLFMTLKAVSNKRVWAWLLIPVFFALALMSKITVISFAIIIPVAIILFSEVGFVTVLLTALLLAIPAFLLLSISTETNKVVTFLGIVFSASFFYVITHFQIVIYDIHLFLKETWSGLFQKKPTINIQETPEENYTIRQVFNGIVPGKELIALKPILVTSILALIYVIGVFYHYSYVVFLTLIPLIILAWKGEKKMAWWAKVMIYLCLVFNASQLGSHIVSYGYIYVTIVSSLFAYVFVFEKRTLFFPILMLYLILTYFSFKIFGDFRNVAYLITVFVIAFVRYARIPVVILNLIYLIIDCKSYLSHPTTLNDLPQFLLTISIALVVYFKKGSNLLVFTLLLLSALVFHLNPNRYLVPLQLENNTKAIVLKANNFNPGIVTAKQDRPLEYLEQCVDSNSSFSIKAGTSLEIIFHYLHKVILPYPMAFYYGYKFIKPQKINETIPLLSLLLHFVLLLSVFVLLKKEPIIGLGLFIYLASISIFSNYFAPIPGMIGDRFLLIPSLGWSFVFIVLLQKGFKWNGTIAGLSAPIKYTFLVILFLYAFLSFTRNGNWKDHLTLFRHDIGYVDSSAQAHNLLALRLMKSSYNTNNPTEQNAIRNEAVEHFKRSVAIYPNYFNTNYDLGRAYAILNQFDNAIPAFKKAIPLNPTFADAYLTVGELLVRQNKFDEAKPFYDSIIKLDPTNFTGYDRLSYLYFLQRNYPLAIQVNKTAIENMPLNPQPYITIGKIYKELNKTDSTKVWLKKALVVNPANIEAQQLLSLEPK